MRRRYFFAFVAVLMLVISIALTLKKLEASLAMLGPTYPFASSTHLEYLELTGATWFGTSHRLFLAETADYPRANQRRVAKVIASASPGDWMGSSDLGVTSLARTDANGYTDCLVTYDGRNPFTTVSRAEYVRELSPSQVLLVRLAHFGRNPFRRSCCAP